MQNEGCGLIGLIVGACLVLAVLAIVFVGKLEDLNDSKSSLEVAKGERQALVLNAQGQASLDRAQAFAMTLQAFAASVTAGSNAALPWVVIFGLGIIFFACFFLVTTNRDRSLGLPNRELPARQVFFLPMPEGDYFALLERFRPTEAQPLERNDHGRR